MTKINANTVRMKEVEIFGIPALYTPCQVSRQTVHLGLYCYELQAESQDHGWPRSLVHRAEKGFLGTVLTFVPMIKAENESKPVYQGDFVDDLQEGYYTPAEFEDKYLSPDYDPLRTAQIYGKAE